MFRIVTTMFLLCQGPALFAQPVDLNADESVPQAVALLSEADSALNAVRGELPECEDGCFTPGEAVALAYEAGEGHGRAGRFLLDVRGGGRSMNGELDDLFFVNSRLGYARYGTLTIAFDTDALWALLRRGRSCGGGLREGRIEVLACSGKANPDLTMFTMMEQLGNRRIVVDGEARLQWIDAATGRPRPSANKRGEHEPGYYQVWVRVEDADQVIFVHED